MSKADYQEIITEYKEQVRVLGKQVNELTDACKTKDAALKRALQKLEHTTDDLDKLQEEKNEPDTKL
jgi:ribosomal protein S15P/S13E